MALAVALRHRQIPFHIFEKDSRFDQRSQGHAVTSTKHVVHTPDGSICGEWGLRKWTGSNRNLNKKRRQNLHVPRQTLRYVLYEALKEASADNNDDSPDISWGHKLVDIQPPKVGLSFQVIDENGNDQGVVTSQADLVVGCDGIFSSVREKFLRVGIVKQITPLRYLHCIVILGICSLGDLFKQESTNLTRQQQKQKQIQLSALLDGETVFQTADGTTRIYLMPYSKKNNEYMWQLSFPIPDEEIALDLSRRGPKALKDEALRRCQSWHVPIPEILNATPIELVSGYPVYDRDLLTAEILSTSRRREIIPRLLTTTTGTDSASTSSSFSFLPTTLLGDAAHPMSPFKGQGANQALIDALSLARILYRVHCREGRSLGDALELYEKEMMDRSSTKVRASSEAAKFLHTEIAIQKGDVTRGAAFSSSSVTKNK
ncbi:FAD/NAD(P)-binding domain-containing protein [Fragilariopsis cylindrus CCMP1102]|uniref:FAD/NAD(P)-binding domain-containing protein n=1 Tax=Fragilariopsis cylindrus CCMP1102 TaxID=635003 RepID=A0A1E7FG44_9STRA|nr:FAD/NAD(P)-binding domain-containing protein [Fragilariopsis cylindrus CCMP1102]|eukprot:OEU17139.1 FAD/NAD(P)-binding domain-containing protein [Fragilariopsis cylindrus CCMP1102]